MVILTSSNAVLFPLAHFLTCLFLLKLQWLLAYWQFNGVSVWRFSLCRAHFSECCEFPLFWEQTSSTSRGGPLQTTRFTKSVSQIFCLACWCCVLYLFLSPVWKTCATIIGAIFCIFDAPFWKWKFCHHLLIVNVDSNLYDFISSVKRK